jgi:hypothetical protein
MGGAGPVNEFCAEPRLLSAQKGTVSYLESNNMMALLSETLNIGLMKGGTNNWMFLVSSMTTNCYWLLVIVVESLLLQEAFKST